MLRCARLHGGSASEDIEYTNEPDMITWDESPDNPRAKMPCGHALTAESLIAYCRSILGAGKFIFYCPHIGMHYFIYCTTGMLNTL